MPTYANGPEKCQLKGLEEIVSEVHTELEILPLPDRKIRKQTIIKNKKNPSSFSRLYLN